jgi:hypothetical protein
MKQKAKLSPYERIRKKNVMRNSRYSFSFHEDYTICNLNYEDVEGSHCHITGKAFCLDRSKYNKETGMKVSKLKAEIKAYKKEMDKALVKIMKVKDEQIVTKTIFNLMAHLYDHEKKYLNETYK